MFLITHLRTICNSNVNDIDYTTFKSEPLKQSNLSLFPLVKELELDQNIKKFNNEEARIIGFPINEENIIYKNMPQKIIYLATPYFSEWNPKHYYFLHFGSTTFKRYLCPVNNCYVTNKLSDVQKAHAVLFHVRDLEIFSMSLNRSPQQIWILYSMEPPWLEIKDMKRFNGVFNWTMSYRRNSDILIKYGFVGRKQESSSKKTPKLENVLDQKADKAVWYVSNCQTDSNREDYIQRLRKIYPVDIIGGCGNKGCRPAETKKCYIKIANHYKFYLAFENAICRDYVTEKLFNPLEYNIIPVTLGGANYSAITPKHSIINAMEFSTPEELGQYLWYVSRNRTLYLSYFAWKDSYRSYLQPWMCELCKKMHDSVPFKANNDLENWWNEGNSCLRWSSPKNNFISITTQIFPKYHKKLF